MTNNSLGKRIVDFSFSLKDNEKLILFMNLNKAGFERGNPCYKIKVDRIEMGKVYTSNGNEISCAIKEGFESYGKMIKNTIFNRLF